MHFFGQCKDPNSKTPKGNMEARQKTQFFIYFFRSNCSKGPFSPFSSVKFSNFGQKLPIRTAHHTLLESRHPKVTKNPYYGLFPAGS